MLVETNLLKLCILEVKWREYGKENTEHRFVSVIFLFKLFFACIFVIRFVIKERQKDWEKNINPDVCNVPANKTDTCMRRAYQVTPI